MLGGLRIERAYEMGADIAANPHYPVVAPTHLRLTSSRSAGPKTRDPQTLRCGARRYQSGDGLVGPLSGAGLT